MSVDIENIGDIGNIYGTNKPVSDVVNTDVVASNKGSFDIYYVIKAILIVGIVLFIIYTVYKNFNKKASMTATSSSNTTSAKDNTTKVNTFDINREVSRLNTLYK